MKLMKLDIQRNQCINILCCCRPESGCLHCSPPYESLAPPVYLFNRNDRWDLLLGSGQLMRCWSSRSRHIGELLTQVFHALDPIFDCRSPSSLSRISLNLCTR